MRRFLLVSPHFPPARKLGAKRAMNMVRHLPGLGWEPTAFCCPVLPEERDPRLVDLLPAEIAVHREFTSRLGRTIRGFSTLGRPRASARRLDPDGPTTGAVDAADNDAHGAAGAATTPRSNRSQAADAMHRVINTAEFSPLDRYMWDLPNAIPRAIELARNTHAEAVWVNADPWSGLVVGAAVARNLGIPFIADLRDPWSIHPRKCLERPRLIQAWTSHIEARLFARARRIVLNMDLCRDAYQEKYAGTIEADRFTSIRNSFDPDFYPEPHPRPSTNPRFEIHYFGGLGASREPEPFYRGLYDFIHKEALAPDALRLVFHAESEPLTDRTVAELGLAPYIEVRPSRPIEAAFADLHCADALLLVEGPKRELQLPAKLYDYLAAGAPILGVGLGPELRQILDGLEGALATGYRDGPGIISQHLSTLYARRNTPIRPSAAALQPYTASAQARCITAVLEEAVA